MRIPQMIRSSVHWSQIPASGSNSHSFKLSALPVARALYWIILIYSSPEDLGVCLWQRERKERMNCCWVSTPGQDQAHHLPEQFSVPPISPTSGSCWPSHHSSAAPPQKQQDHAWNYWTKCSCPSFRWCFVSELSSFWFCTSNRTMGFLPGCGWGNHSLRQQ